MLCLIHRLFWCRAFLSFSVISHFVTEIKTLHLCCSRRLSLSQWKSIFENQSTIEMKEARTYRAGLKNKYIIVSFLLILHEISDLISV